MAYPATALPNQWAAGFVNAANMKANVDDNLNAMAANMSLWGQDFAVFRAKAAVSPAALDANIGFGTVIEDAANAWTGVGQGWDSVNKRYVVQKNGLYAIQAGWTQATAVAGVLEIFGVPSPFTGVTLSGQMGNAATYGQDIDLTAQLVTGNQIALRMRGALASANAAGISTWTYLTIQQIGY
jgi:hypothetical protein